MNETTKQRLLDLFWAVLAAAGIAALQVLLEWLTSYRVSTESTALTSGGGGLVALLRAVRRA